MIPSSSVSVVAQLSPGAVFGGDFRVVEPLGTGGMGAVYVAEQLSTGKRRAVKVMHPSLVADAKLRERFVQEARVGALIESDHVVEVIGAGVDEPTGMPWIAMELLEGEDLAHWLARRGRVSPAELLHLMRPLCHALGAAHAAGVVHRDIKPENLFLARTRSAEGTSSLKVLDFGIAKVAAQAKTAATQSIGTPLWMAPEQSDPRATISPAADVWAIGLLAYWLLTGRQYWRTGLDPSSSMQAMMREVLLEPMHPASQRAREQGVAEPLPTGFDEWLARCIDREPMARYTNATDAMTALAAIVPGSAVGPSAPPPSPSTAPLDSDAATIAQPPPGGVSSEAATVAVPPPAGTADGVSSEAATLLAPGPPASAAQASSPVQHAPTGSPTVRSEEPAKKTSASAIGIVFAAATVLVVLGVGALVALFALKSSPDEGPSPTAAQPAGPGEPTEAPPSPETTSDPVAEVPTVPPPRRAHESGPRKARRGAKTPGKKDDGAKEPADGADESAPPFDHRSADHKLGMAARRAQRLCSKMKGPQTISVSVTFSPGGQVKSVVVPITQRASPAGSCVTVAFRTVRVAAFSGPPVTKATAVTLTP